MPHPLRIRLRDFLLNILKKIKCVLTLNSSCCNINNKNEIINIIEDAIEDLNEEINKDILMEKNIIRNEPII